MEADDVKAWVDEWVEATLGALTVEEKAGMCSGADFWTTKAVARLGMPTLAVADGPHGLRQSTGDGLRGSAATCFPTASGLACSWDPELAEEVGAAIAREARAHGVGVVLGPGANIKRHPLCGRNFEYFSEDPLLSGQLAAGMIRGLQREGVGASLKHYAANNQEGWRNVADSVVDERALREIYLASFEHAVRGGDPATVMCSYNPVNGTYASEHERLLTTVLRDEWGWDGVVVSDWGAVNDRVAGVRAGLELEMPASGGLNDARIVQAVRTGALATEVLDRCVRRVLRLVARYHDGAAGAGGAVDALLVDALPVDADAHHVLARRAAAASAVLLTNDGVLPLAPAGTIAVIGAFATEPRYQGAGSSQVTPTRLDTLLDALRAEVGGRATVTHAAGYEAANARERPDLVDEAARVAAAADVAVVLVGLPASFESEGFDRRHMRLPAQHDRLVEAVLAANANTVVVVVGGSACELPWAERPRALLLANLGGQAGGSGLADVLLGTVNPSGRLAETYPLHQSDHGADGWFPGRRQVQYRESIYVGYRWFDTVGLDVRFPFGHGLGYTTFAIDHLTLVGGTDADAPDFAQHVQVTVTNTGTVEGMEVVQVYVRGPQAVVHRPDRELRGFARVHLAPGESRQVTITLDRRAFAYWCVATHAWEVEPGSYEVLVGASSRDIRARASVTLTSAHVAAAVAPGAGWVPSSAALTAEAFAAMLGRAIPAERPARPFDVNSTLSEVAVVWPGKKLLATVYAQAMKQYGVAPEPGGPDGSGGGSMVHHGVRELPLRGLVLLGRGKFTWKTLDRLLWLLNKWPARRSRPA